jgi:hypothetical protein
MRRVIAAVAQMGITADVEHIHSLREIAEHGVLPTPVFTIGGKIKTKGRLLSPAEIKQMLGQAGQKSA